MFKERLKKLREAKGWTQKQVAEALEINPRTYSSYENNEREPNSEILLQLADLFECSIDYLLGLDKNRILKKELGRKQTESLSQSEIELIHKYRKLSYLGKDYINTTIEMCTVYFPDDNESKKMRNDLIIQRMNNISKKIADSQKVNK